MGGGVLVSPNKVCLESKPFKCC